MQRAMRPYMPESPETPENSGRVHLHPPTRFTPFRKMLPQRTVCFFRPLIQWLARIPRKRIFQTPRVGYAPRHCASPMLAIATYHL